MDVSWAQPLKAKGVLVAWRRRMEKSWVLGVWKTILWLFGGLFGRKGTDIFLREKKCSFKISSSTY